MKKLMLKICAIALSVTLVSVAANSEANAQIFLNGRPATATEIHHLQEQGFGFGAWHVDGWGIAAAQHHAERVSAPAYRCHYVLDVPLDCEIVVAPPLGAAARGIAEIG